MARDMMRWLPTAIIGVVVLNCVANNWGQEPTVSDVTAMKS
jgi:hypothetical protein